MSDFEKAKQEQEKKRELWRQQQKARMQKRLPEDLLTNRQNDRQQQERTESEQESATERNFRAITQRLRKQKIEESKRKEEKQKGKGKIEEAKEKIKKTKEAVKRLKTIYRVINGTAGVTLVGLIITFLVMNAQLFLGNLLKLKVIPALSKIEIFIILFIDFVIFIGILLTVLPPIVAVAIMMENPIIKFIANFFNLSI